VAQFIQASSFFSLFLTPVVAPVKAAAHVIGAAKTALCNFLSLSLPE